MPYTIGYPSGQFELAVLVLPPSLCIPCSALAEQCQKLKCLWFCTALLKNSENFGVLSFFSLLVLMILVLFVVSYGCTSIFISYIDCIFSLPYLQTCTARTLISTAKSDACLEQCDINKINTSGCTCLYVCNTNSSWLKVYIYIVCFL